MEASTPAPDGKDTASLFAGDVVALRSVIGEELYEGLFSFRLELEETLRRVLREESSTRQVPADVPSKMFKDDKKLAVLNGTKLTEPPPVTTTTSDSLREVANDSSQLPGSIGPVLEEADTQAPAVVVAGISDSALPQKNKSKRADKGKQTKMALFSQEQVEQHLTRLQWLTNHKGYEIFSGVLIIVNTLWLGYQTQHLALMYKGNADRNEELSMPPLSFFGVQTVFCFLFFWELVLRWAAEGFIGFLRSHELTWNVLDIVVVSTSCFEVALAIFAHATHTQKSDALQNVSVIRVLRVVRIVRVARVIRVMKFFRELRMMIFAILGCVKNLMWVMVVLLMTFYMFAILFVTAAVDHLDTAAKWRDEHYTDMVECFGSMDMAILSLFMAMSGGDDWSKYYYALVDLPLYYRLAFLGFIAFCLFAVINIVTGVFVESALQANVKDRDIVVHEELQAKKEYLQSMRDLFEEMDGDFKGTITVMEFEEKLKDERVIAYFNALKLDVSDATTLFHLIDDDSSNEIGIDEFLHGCYKLQGESRSLDMKIMQSEVHVIDKKFTAFSEETHATLSEVRALLNILAGESR